MGDGGESVRSVPLESSDEALWIRVKDGELDAFNVVMKRYERRLFAFVVNLVGNVQEAEDVLQDTFLRAYRNRAQWNGRRAKFSTWLYTIATNRSRDVLRKRRRFLVRSLEDKAGEDRELGELVPDRAGSPRRTAERAELSGRLSKAFQQLPRQLREVLLLSECEGLDYREIAQVVGCSVGTVKSRAFRARRELRRSLERLEPDVEILTQIRVEEVI
jgi:RNA polymerase sigma-70 factor (ECF subfamily)